MQKRSLVVLALGSVIALGTAVSLHNRMKGESNAVEQTQVLVAAVDVPAGSFVRADAQLAMINWPKENITSVMLTNATTKAEDFNGAVARRNIAKGEPILKSALVRSNEGGFMSAVLDAGKRAVSIPVDATTGNAGFIFPGDHVDLILTHSVNHSSSNTQTRASETFVEDVRVLAVDQSLDNPENKAVLAKTVTLEVTPKQAEEINVAKDLGKISLSLRSLAKTPMVHEENGKQVETLDDVLQENIAAERATLGGQSPSVTRDTDVSRVITPEDAAGARVQVIRGNERSEILFGTAAEVNRAPQ